MESLERYLHESSICAGGICVGTKVLLDIGINILLWILKGIGIDIHTTLGMVCDRLFRMSIGIWNFGRCIYIYTHQLKIYNIGVDIFFIVQHYYCVRQYFATKVV